MGDNHPESEWEESHKYEINCFSEGWVNKYYVVYTVRSQTGIRRKHMHWVTSFIS